ncbi:MAG TPA: dynamin family protein [Pseudonocardiaceae bacterium]|nr:dynamin family protein [Pseudonocardiaceae bacterium]
MSSPARIPLPQAVKQTAQQVLALLRQGDPATAEWVEQVRARRPASPTVVVVGETNRGKSSLVNALLATPGLSPVDADTATATYLVFEHADDWKALACYPGELEPVAFELAQLPAWVSTSGTLPEGQLPPRYVRVAGPVPLLDRLTLVDTPGVGGLDSMHGELAKEAAEAATALLFVVDASAPLTASELGFLREVGDRVETVVFALTKTDAFRGWRQVLAANKELLAKYAPRFADAVFHPVSARMFELAATAPNPDAAAMLRERAGIPQVQTALQELVVGRSVMLVQANGLRALDTGLAAWEAELAGRQRALTGAEDEAEALRARRDELATLRRSSTRGWQVKLRGEVQRARVETNHEVSKEIRDLQSWFRQAIDSADREALPGLPEQVDTALQLVSGRLSAGLSARLDRVSEVSLAELFSAEELDVIRAQFARGERPPVSLRPPEKRAPNAEDRLLVFMGVTGGFGAARVAALPLAGLGVAALNPFVLPATIVIGLGAGWWLARTRKHAAEKQQMKQWLTEAIADARSTMDQLVSEQLIEAEQQLALALDDVLGRRIESIEAELREVDKTMKLAAGERARQQQAVGRQLAEARAGRERIGVLLGGIRELRDKH